LDAPTAGPSLAGGARPRTPGARPPPTLLDQMDGDVVGLDWRIALDEGWDVVGDRGVQGNLDPAALLAPWDRLESATLDVLERARGRNGHIFNLGHGILPQTDPDAVTRLTDLVQTRTVEARV
jgi:uroporphyrinogen decarboxylase